MLQIDLKNMLEDAVGEKNGISRSDIEALGKMSAGAHETFSGWRKTGDAIFYDYVFEDDILDGIEEKAGEISQNFDNAVVLGIGGSALGLRCAAQALLPPFWNMMDRKGRGGRPRIFVCDNIDPDSFAGLLGQIDIEKTCFIVISKSGRTVETAAQFFIVLERLKEKMKDGWRRNVVIITDPKSGELRPMVKSDGLASFAIPPKLGGRFSVLSPVGLFPAACVGIDVKALLDGARGMAKRCPAPSGAGRCPGGDLEGNIAYRVGGYKYLLDSRKGKHVSVMMPYSDALMLASDWYVQLWAESLGKSGGGQTPVKALGSTDQHSQVQLYMEGPADKVFTFLRVEKFRAPAKETTIGEAPGFFGFIDGRGMGEILNTMQMATAGALASARRPNMTISFPLVDAYHLGEFFMLYELATAYAGALYRINPFDQPGVELGKKLTREILERGA